MTIKTLQWIIKKEVRRLARLRPRLTFSDLIQISDTEVETLTETLRVIRFFTQIAHAKAMRRRKRK